MTVVMARMDAGAEAAAGGRWCWLGSSCGWGSPLAVLYVSLKYLNGSVYALVAGLATGYGCPDD